MEVNLESHPDGNLNAALAAGAGGLEEQRIDLFGGTGGIEASAGG